MTIKRNIDSVGNNEELPLGQKQGDMLLSLARTAISDFLHNQYIPPHSCDDPALETTAGVFVTLWNKASSPRMDVSENLRLRGCIGRLRSDDPLYYSVQESAISAATHDPRFPPLAIEELPKIIIEVAVLSPFEVVQDLREIDVGQHGLMLEGLGRRGLLLPKVATRLGWNQEEFFHGLCQKAGLPTSCWPNDAILYRFSAISFIENQSS